MAGGISDSILQFLEEETGKDTTVYHFLKDLIVWELEGEYQYKSFYREKIDEYSEKWRCRK